MKPSKHGRDHLPGGEDPIPGFHAWAFARLTTPQEISLGSTEALGFDDFWTNAPTLFSTVPNGAAGDTQIECAQFGVYIATLTVEWEDIGASYPHSCQIDTSRQIGGRLTALGASAASASEAEWPSFGTNGPLDTGDVLIGVHEAWDYTPTQPAGWTMFASNGHSAAVDVTRANLMVMLLPNAANAVNYVIY